METIANSLSKQKGKFDSFGEHVADSLSLMNNRQAIYAKKLIQEILTLGELFELDDQTKIKSVKYNYDCLESDELGS